jgi:DNA (cytosine-5)-methyltransferase 1
VFCEKDEWCQRILGKNFGVDIPIVADIHDFDGNKFRNATVLSSGTPCQPASSAGKRRGTADDRWLWPEALRVVSESRPKWVVFENPRGILTLESGVVFDGLLSELEALGYETRAFVVPACAVDAKHRRDRVWIVAHAEGVRRDSQAQPAVDEEKDGREEGRRPYHGGQDEGDIVSGGAHCVWEDESKRFSQSGVRRVATRIPDKMDRLRGLGNAVVPQLAYQILRGIAVVEKIRQSGLDPTKPLK